MERRFVLFLVLSVAIVVGHVALMQRLNPPKNRDREGDPQRVAAERGGDAEAEKPQDKGGQELPPLAEAEPGPLEDQPKPPEDQPKPPHDKPEPDIPRRWGTLGSADPADPYRMLVTWDNKGAAVARIELSSPRYRNLWDRNGHLWDRSGYLGHLVMDTAEVGKDVQGCLVQVVGHGTPAAKAGLKPGDLIVALAEENKKEKKIAGVEDLQAALEKTKPEQTVSLTVIRSEEKGGKQRPKPLSVTLGSRPLEMIRPEGEDHRSFLLTLRQLDDQELSRDEDDDSVAVGKELAGLDLWSGNWEVVEADPAHVVFRRMLSNCGLEITKTYRLAEVPADNYKAYHLAFHVKIRNIGSGLRKIAYQLDGPTGLPAEGGWYAYKVSRSWGGAGLRDVVVSFDRGTPSLIGCPKIADGKVDGLPWQPQSVTYIGVDAQYFAAVLIPQKENPSDIWFDESQPLRVGEVNEQKKLTNTSCRVVSKTHRLKPGAELAHSFEIFSGPKKPKVLAQYGLGELVYYGWFSALARPMSGILHFFYAIVHNYGLAILMLTVLVRGCMFPLSRKQALGARKMQELQPELKKIQEKYKKDMEARTKAQQELFRKHNYNPLSGCLVLFIQLPIFIALYRSLMVDVELRQAPLLWEGFRWCSNLSAPDMLFNWSGFMPEFVTRGVGFLGLGPYFNILPVLTIGLFIAQQKMFMPPPTDDQSAMQQKIMKYMMVFMGLIFFKVASGLCVYFIASSLWGLAERKFLPKASPAKPAPKPPPRAEAKVQAKPRPKPMPQQALSGRDGTPAHRKKKKKSKRGKR